MTEKPKRRNFNTTLDVNLMKKLRILAAQLEKRQNDLIEEGIRDLLKKYKDNHLTTSERL